MNDQTIVDEEAAVTVNTADSKKHFARNTLAALLFYAFNTITSIWMVPYQISHLGISNYGMVSLANNFGNYMQLFTIALVGIIARFVAQQREAFDAVGALQRAIVNFQRRQRRGRQHAVAESGAQFQRRLTGPQLDLPRAAPQRRAGVRGPLHAWRGVTVKDRC